MDKLRIATRKSPLALWQAAHVRRLIQRTSPNVAVELVPVTTSGDRTRDATVLGIGGKGLFLKELESLMLEGEADLAVHSMKDVPLTLPDGFVVTTAGPRGDVRDAFVGRETLAELPGDARIGSSSLRRRALVAALWNRQNVESIRGNVQTRLTKLDLGRIDALILAAVGLQRLGLDERIVHLLDPSTFVPAVGQGALGVEYRCDRGDVQSLLRGIREEDVEIGVTVERHISHRLGADCAMPLGVYSDVSDSGVRIVAIVLSQSGDQRVRVEMRGEDGLAVADRVADRLLKLGAESLMAAS